MNIETQNVGFYTGAGSEPIRKVVGRRLASGQIETIHPFTREVIRISEPGIVRTEYRGRTFRFLVVLPRTVSPGDLEQWAVDLC